MAYALDIPKLPHWKKCVSCSFSYDGRKYEEAKATAKLLLAAENVMARHSETLKKLKD